MDNDNKRPIPDYGDKMRLQDFIVDCFNDCLIDYDGYGYYSDGEFMYGRVYPSEICNGDFKIDYPFIIWFNR